MTSPYLDRPLFPLEAALRRRCACYHSARVLLVALYLMHQPRGRCVRKQRDRIGDPKPSCSPGAVPFRRELMGAGGAFQRCLFSVACDHEIGDAPNVDFRDHERELIRRPYIDG